MLIWRLILKEYSKDIEYIQGNKNIVTYLLSKLTINVNQETTQESTNKKQIVSEITDTEELPKNIFPII